MNIDDPHTHAREISSFVYVVIIVNIGFAFINHVPLRSIAIQASVLQIFLSIEMIHLSLFFFSFAHNIKKNEPKLHGQIDLRESQGEQDRERE